MADTPTFSTNRHVAALKPDTKRYAARDVKHQGHYCRVTPKGSKTFWAVARNPKKKTQVWQQIGRAELLDVDESREEARKIIRRIRAGLPPVEEAPVTDTLGTHFYGDSTRNPPLLGYLKHRQTKEFNRAWRETQRIFERDILPAVTGADRTPWKDRDIESINKRDIVALLNGKVDTPVMRNRALSEIRAFFGWLEGQAVLDNIPSFKKMAVSETSRDRTLGYDPERQKDDHDELRALWDATAGYPFGLAIRLMLITGKRRSEVAGMTDAETDNQYWYIPKHRAKNGVSDKVYLSDLALEIIDEARRHRPDENGKVCCPVGDDGQALSPFVFSTTHGEKAINGFSKAKAGIDTAMAAWLSEHADRDLQPWRLHDLRRTVASSLQDLGYSRDVADAVLAHKLTGVTAVYLRSTLPKQKQAALFAWAEKLRSIIHGQAENVVDIESAR